MRIYFTKYDWTPACYKPSFNRMWSGKLWNFSVYKYGVTLDFRKGNVIDWLKNKPPSP